MTKILAYTVPTILCPRPKKLHKLKIILIISLQTTLILLDLLLWIADSVVLFCILLWHPLYLWVFIISLKSNIFRLFLFATSVNLFYCFSKYQVAVRWISNWNNCPFSSLYFQSYHFIFFNYLLFETFFSLNKISSFFWRIWHCWLRIHW